MGQKIVRICQATLCGVIRRLVTSMKSWLDVTFAIFTIFQFWMIGIPILLALQILQNRISCQIVKADITLCKLICYTNRHCRKFQWFKIPFKISFWWGKAIIKKIFVDKAISTKLKVLSGTQTLKSWQLYLSGAMMPIFPDFISNLSQKF